MKHPLALACLVSITLFGAASAAAQLPACTGNDAEGASAAFEEGNRLMAQAIEQAGRRRVDRARELAAQALVQFDEQCTLGDESALAERGAALMLMGEALRSAQSYDAYLSVHPLASLDARTRRRIEANLQPGSVAVDLDGDGDAITLFIDDLDFGALPRAQPVRLPLGEHVLEARDASGAVLASVTSLLAEGAADAIVRLSLPIIETIAVVPVREPEPEPEPDVGPIEEPPPARTDFMPYYLATGIAAGVFLGAAIGLQVGADGRAQTFNALCRDPSMPSSGCDAVRSEYDGLFGAAIASYVLAGLAAIGLGTVLALDLSQPRERIRIALTPMRDGVAAGVSGRF